MSEWVAVSHVFKMVFSILLVFTNLNDSLLSSSVLSQSPHPHIPSYHHFWESSNYVSLINWTHNFYLRKNLLTLFCHNLKLSLPLCNFLPSLSRLSTFFFLSFLIPFLQKAKCVPRTGRNWSFDEEKSVFFASDNVIGGNQHRRPLL